MAAAKSRPDAKRLDELANVVDRAASWHSPQSAKGTILRDVAAELRGDKKPAKTEEPAPDAGSNTSS